MRAADYVEETTTSIAGTSGDGAVTMTQITNVPRFSTVFGTGATTVRYEIEDTVNKKFEMGIGSVASNVLTRTSPKITWDGSALDDSSPSAIQFGSSPTSGNIKIRMAAVAETLFPVAPGRQTTISGDSNWRDYDFSASIRYTGSFNNLTLTADREYYQAYLCLLAGSLNGMQVNVQSTPGASNIKVALYSIGSSGLPDQKICDFNTLNSGTTGVKTDTTTSTWSPAGPIYMTPGWYAIGFICNAAINLNAGPSGLSMMTTQMPFGRKNVYGGSTLVYVSGSYTTGLPATPTWSGATLGDPGTAHSNVAFALKIQP